MTSLKGVERAPCNSQTRAELEAYYRNVVEGDPTVIRCMQGGMLEYVATKISGVNRKIGRVYVEQGDPWGGRAYYAKSGKSCFHPKGQSHLVVPTDKVMAWITEDKMPAFIGDVDPTSFRRARGAIDDRTGREIGPFFLGISGISHCPSMARIDHP